MLLEKGRLGLGEEVESRCAAGLKKGLKGAQGLGFLIHPLRTIQGLGFPRSAPRLPLPPTLPPPETPAAFLMLRKEQRELHETSSLNHTLRSSVLVNSLEQ